MRSTILKSHRTRCIRCIMCKQWLLGMRTPRGAESFHAYIRILNHTGAGSLLCHERTANSVLAEDEDILPKQGLPVAFTAAVATASSKKLPSPSFNVSVPLMKNCPCLLSSPGGVYSSDSTIETIHVVILTGVGSTIHPIQVASPPSSSSAIMQLPVLSWGLLLRDLKPENIRQFCLVGKATALDNHNRLKGMTPKSAREEILAA
uniref:Uncharacterized protein n=1 Tax=Hyaloperonospora arabidopsidis (strain Emoy2) TaxID=559515 RepID=M4BGN6_HYAAE